MLNFSPGTQIATLVSLLYNRHVLLTVCSGVYINHALLPLHFHFVQQPQDCLHGD